MVYIVDNKGDIISDNKGNVREESDSDELSIIFSGGTWKDMIREQYDEYREVQPIMRHEIIHYDGRKSLIDTLNKTYKQSTRYTIVITDGEEGMKPSREELLKILDGDLN